MKISNVLHLYLGCDVELDYFEKKYIGKLLYFTEHTWNIAIPGNAAIVAYNNNKHSITPILKRLSDMTEEDARYFFTDVTGNYAVTNPKHLFQYNRWDHFNTSQAALAVTRLLSKGYWLFDDSAFDQGLIIDAKTLNH